MKKSTILLSILLSVGFVKGLLMAGNFSYKDIITGGMTCVIVQHEVSDFNKWKIAYEDDATRRKKAGIREMLVLQGDTNSNLVTVVFEVSHLPTAKSFFSDPETAALMGSAGVSSVPQFIYFKVSNSSITHGSSFMIIHHKVEDYTRWKQAFDQHESERLAYKVHVTAVGKLVDEPTHVLAILNAKNAANFFDFLEKSDLKEAMKEAGVISEPVSIILKKTN